MSFDLGVWYSDAAMNETEAGAVYGHINSDWVVVERHPEFDAFLSDLLARFPDLRSPSIPAMSPDATPAALLETMDDLRAAPLPTEAQIQQASRQEPPPDESPWAATLWPTGSAISLPIIWSRVDEVMPVIYELAARHGLIVYDPQSNTVTVPPQLRQTGPSELAEAHLRMQVGGKPPALDIAMTLDGKFLTHSTAVNRLQAHAQAREIAIQRHLAVYEVADPASLAQAMQFVPLDANDPNQPRWLKDLPKALGLRLFKMTAPDADKP